jgi:hypothetical protein
MSPAHSIANEKGEFPMPVVRVNAASSGTIKVTLNGSVLIPSGSGGSGSRNVPAGTECKVSWTVRDKGSSYEVHVTAPVKRDRKVAETTQPIVIGGFAAFTA